VSAEPSRAGLDGDWVAVHSNRSPRPPNHVSGGGGGAHSFTEGCCLLMAHSVLAPAQRL
jgi:hypothetical protein